MYVRLVKRRETSSNNDVRLFLFLSITDLCPSTMMMMLNRLLSVSTLLVLIATASAQTISGFIFDSRDVVSMIWGFEGAVTTRYDFWLCAGDETTGSYV